MHEKACGAIVFHNEKVLIIKRNKGFYELPKGHVEENETEQETAKREVKEETNITYKQLPHFKHIIHYQPQKGVDKEVVYFLGIAKHDDVKRQKSEIAKAEFVNVKQALKQLTHQNNKDALQKAYKKIKEKKELF